MKKKSCTIQEKDVTSKPSVTSTLQLDSNQKLKQDEHEKSAVDLEGHCPFHFTQLKTGNKLEVRELDSNEKLKKDEHEKSNVNSEGRCPFHLTQLETGEKLEVKLSEVSDIDKPRHAVGCTQHECHGAMMDKNGFDPVSNNYSQSTQSKLDEAKKFVTQFATETESFPTEEGLKERLAQIEHDICLRNTYQHTFEELEYGCRLAWRNSGRCIMRKVSFSLELRDCRNVNTAQAYYEEIVKHIEYAANKGTIKPVISIFPQKEDGKSAPVRIWNRQLLGYAAYKRKDCSVMGDPININFTAFCVHLGWEPPVKKSDFDILPLVISDEITGHDKPYVFELPQDIILEVSIHHPDHELFSMLNLRWYAVPASKFFQLS